MLLLIYFTIFTGLCVATSNKFRDRKDAALYSSLRKAFQLFKSSGLHQSKPAHRVARFRTNSRGPGGAVPFWFGKYNIPYTNIWVGSPPQKVPVFLDTGSDFTWLQTSSWSSGNSSYSFFDSNMSKTWRPLDISFNMSYLDGGSCSVQAGLERVSVGGLAFHIPIGIAPKHCQHFDYGIMGLNKCSDFLKAFIRNPGNLPMVFAFTFNDAETGEGENWFSMGGYAGLDTNDIQWTETDKSPSKNESFWVDIPYISYNNKKAEIKSGHSAIVDTGSTLGVLPGDVWTEVFGLAPGFPAIYENEDGELKRLGLFNLTDVSPELFPTMALRIGDLEWLAELSNMKLNIAPRMGFKENRILSLPSFLPTDVFEELLNTTNIPSIIGATFWSNLKGLVFDFTPGKEKVGFVPRKKLVNNNGLINPLFSNPYRSSGSCFLGRLQSVSFYCCIAAFVTIFSFILLE